MTSTEALPEHEERQQPRDSRGHYLPFGSVPWALEPDAWDDTCRHAEHRMSADGSAA